MLINLFTLSAAGLASLSSEELARLQQGEIIIRESQPLKPDGQSFEIIGYMEASVGVLVQLLTDYQHYPDFIPSVDRVEIVEQQGPKATLNYHLKPILGRVKKYRVSISDKAMEGGWIIHWQQVPWPELQAHETIADTEGSWQILEQNPERSLVVYSVYSDPGPIPFGLGMIVAVLSRSSIAEVFTATKLRAEQLSSALAP